MDTQIHSAISATLPDWARETPVRFWDPGRKLLKSLRDYQKWRQRKGFAALIIQKLCVFRHRFWSVVTGADIPLNCQIGGGLRIPHPNGIVIHPAAIIGVNCLIHQQVTIGTKMNGGYPVIKGHVDMGAGAKILGGITLHEHCLVGANAVVTKDVNSYEVVAGIPAKVVKKLSANQSPGEE
ncbi:MAG: serine acetyltransferase [Methylococcaceae bacterium]|nr:serine acetyltransferase [Methylococcaceae bacterium]